ncbi:hypothetical protein M5689_017166 [Euphorbia peplus]|nr:hypothetical protein M5689_017166 [Euphorbia peplus]
MTNLLLGLRCNLQPARTHSGYGGGDKLRGATTVTLIMLVELMDVFQTLGTYSSLLHNLGSGNDNGKFHRALFLLAIFSVYSTQHKATRSSRPTVTITCSRGL